MYTRNTGLIVLGVIKAVVHARRAENALLRNVCSESPNGLHCGSICCSRAAVPLVLAEALACGNEYYGFE